MALLCIKNVDKKVGKLVFSDEEQCLRLIMVDNYEVLFQYAIIEFGEIQGMSRRTLHLR